MSDLLDSDVMIVEEEVDIKDTQDYGIGIDCHKLFIVVCVRTKKNGVFVATTAQFSTEWASILRAKDWCLEILQRKSDIEIDPSQPLHYVIESTATYHYPIIIAWGGRPSIINPTLAGATRKKSDRLDAKILAQHDQTSVWRESYRVPEEVEVLRLMIAERDRYQSEARAASNRINNALTRFGYNLGCEGSVTADRQVRSIIEDQISDSPTDIEGICPIRLPMDVRLIIREEYTKHDDLKMRTEIWKAKILKQAYSMAWPIGGNAKISGEEMIPRLMTAPQMGELTSITWLANVVDPNRFHSDRALAAYCALDPSLRTSAGHVTSTKKRGGCKELHRMLCNCASRLISRHNEMFGQWGFRMYNQTGKWKKATNAVGRKLAVAMYHMMMTNQDFSYENYRMASKASSFSIPVEDLPLLNPGFNRYVRILKAHGIDTTPQMVTAYLSCSLGTYRGLGKKFFGLLRDFTNNQKKYQDAYKELRAEHTETCPDNKPTEILEM